MPAQTELHDENVTDEPSSSRVVAVAREESGARGAVRGARFAPTSQGALVGRERELDALREAFAETRRRRCVAVRLHGETGSGKTALLSAFLEELAADPGALVLSGRCYERQSARFKAVDGLVDALAGHLATLAPPEVEALLPRDVVALAKLFPALGRVAAVRDAPGGHIEELDPKDIRASAFGAMRELFCRLSDGNPVVLAIDDLQWCDVDSIALILELLRPPYPPPLLFLATHRIEEANASPALRAFRDLQSVASLRPGVATSKSAAPVVDLRSSITTARRIRPEATCDVRALEVAPLPVDSARKLIAALVAPLSIAPDGVDAIVDDASGSPFLLVELARGVVDAVSPNATSPSTPTPSRATSSEAPPVSARPESTRLEALVHDRLASMPHKARILLEVIAVAGRPVDAIAATRATGLGGDREGLAYLRTHHWVRTSSNGERETIEIYHHRIRKAVIARLSPWTLKRHHRGLAGSLEEAEEADAEELMTHFRGAGEPARASHYAAAAADHAASMLAFERAAALYRIAIDLADAAEVATRLLRVRLAGVLADCGRSAEAAYEYLAAAADVEGEQRLELHRLAAQHFLNAGHVDEGLSVIESVLDALGTTLPATPRNALFSLLFRRLQLWARGLAFRERAATDVAPDALTRMDTYWSLGVGLAVVDTIRGADFHSRHLLLALGAGEPYRVAKALAIEACFSATAGGAHRRRTAALVQAAESLSARIAHPYAIALARGAAGYEAFHQGRWREARERLEHAERMFEARRAGLCWEVASVRIFWVATVFFLGRLRALADRVPALIADAEARGDRFAETSLRTGHASAVWLVGDDPEAGHLDVADAAARWSQQGFHLQHYYALHSRSQLDLYQGNGDSAWARVQEGWPHLEASLLLRIERVRLEALYLHGRCALAAFDHGVDDRAKLLRTARDDARRIAKARMPWATPLAELLLAAVAQRVGDRTQASDRLRRAHDGFCAADMSLYAAVTKRRHGEVLGGDEGRALVAEADAEMREEEIASPERMAQMLVPTFVE